MSVFSKRVSINQDILLEYIYDDSNFRSDDYKVLTNLKDNSKSYISKIGLNTEENSLLLIDSVNDKYSPVNLSNFNAELHAAAGQGRRRQQQRDCDQAETPDRDHASNMARRAVPRTPTGVRVPGSSRSAPP